MLTPLVLAVVEDARLPPVPYLLAVCMGSNSGSVATFTGNPQNMLIQGASGLSYAQLRRVHGPAGDAVHRASSSRRCCTCSARSCPCARFDRAPAPASGGPAGCWR